MLSVFKIVMALIMFGVIIFVHELGHFLVAKACGVRVNEFALGMGPKIFSFGKKETTYSLRLFPLGGFCAMEGEDEDSDDPAAFGNKKVWQRILVVIAGVLMNFLLGFLVLIVTIGFFSPPNSKGEVLYPTTRIAQIYDGASSYDTGLRAGDEIVSINSRPVLTTNDVIINMQSDEDGVMPMMVRREIDGKKQLVSLPDVTFTLETQEDGTRYIRYDFAFLGVDPTVWNTVTTSFKTECSLVTTVWYSLVDMIGGKYGLNEIAGPIGTVDLIGDMVGQAATEASRENIYSVLFMFALICVNVGVMNLLPLPALDGGRLVFLLIELIFRRPVPQKFEGMVHFIGFALLIVLMIVIAFNDVFRLATGG